MVWLWGIPWLLTAGHLSQQSCNTVPGAEPRAELSLGQPLTQSGNAFSGETIPLEQNFMLALGDFPSSWS